MKKTFESKSGSALLVTLLVVSLLLVVVVTFSAYVRMELRAINSRMELVQARQNAKLGMHLALDKLQIVAGPDQRVTARGKILGESIHSDSQWYTGVWDTRFPNEDPFWLVTTRNALGEYDRNSPLNVEDALSGPTQLLVGGGTFEELAPTANWVRVPSARIPGNQVNGQIAYWVSDEGVKASLALTNPLQQITTLDSLAESELSRSSMISSHRNATEFAFWNNLEEVKDVNYNFDDNSTATDLQKLSNLDDFSHLALLRNPEKNPTMNGSGNFHDYTLNARGLMTNPLSGGIKKDLSMAPDMLGPGFEAYMDFPSYMQEPRGTNSLVKSHSDARRLHLTSPSVPSTPSTGDIVHRVAPIITDFGIQFSPRNNGGTVEFAMRFVLELWNPYSSGLVAEDMTLEISGFEPVTVRVGEDWQNQFDLAQTFGDGNKITIRLSRDQFHTNPNPAVHPNSLEGVSHPPGRILYWVGPDLRKAGLQDASFATRSSSAMTLYRTAVPGKSFAGTTNSMQVRYAIPETNLTVALKNANNVVISKYENFNFEETDTGDTNNLSSLDRRFLTYQFRMTERGHTLLAPGTWLEEIDRRTPTPTFSDLQDPAQFTHTIREDATSSSPGDSALKNTLKLSQTGQIFYFDRIVSNSNWSKDPRRNISLYELPRQPLLSIGQLQHLLIYNMPPYSIGNPWGGQTWNQLFDEYALSGIQKDISIPNFNSESTVHPHPRYRFTDPENLGLQQLDEAVLNSLGEDTTISMEVNGQFNLNSDSVSAWKTVLGSNLFRDFQYMEQDDNAYDNNNKSVLNMISLNNHFPSGFTRFPQSIQELFDVDYSLNPIGIDSDFDRHITTMKQITRFLSPRIDVVGNESDYDLSNTEALNEFAEMIVESIRERIETQGRPYFNLTEFLTEDFRNGNSLLETILSGNVDATKYPVIASGFFRSSFEPRNGSISIEDAEPRTPAWTSQADIITPLSPFISTRSDTFTIRAYGDYRTSNDDIVSSAVCEVVVQRVITPMDGTKTLADYSSNVESHFGRKFKILSFSWLNESDI